MQYNCVYVKCEFIFNGQKRANRKKKTNRKPLVQKPTVATEPSAGTADSMKRAFCSAYIRWVSACGRLK